MCEIILAAADFEIHDLLVVGQVHYQLSYRALVKHDLKPKDATIPKLVNIIEQEIGSIEWVLTSITTSYYNIYFVNYYSQYPILVYFGLIIIQTRYHLYLVLL